MAFNWLDSVKGLFTSELISKAASSLGEGEGNTAKAISGIVPSVLGGIISKGTSGIEGASSILDMAKGAVGTGIPGNLGNLFAGGSNTLLPNGLDMVKRLLGDKLNSISGVLSGYAGIKESSVTSLMGIVAPMALGVLGQHASQNNLTPNSLSNMLAGQKSSITEALPAGLGSLAGLTGLSSVGSTISSMTGGIKQATTSSVHTAAHEVEKAGSNKRWLLPMLLAVLVIILVWLFSRSCNKEVAVTPPIADTTSASSLVPAGPGPVSIKVRLPDGTELDVYKGGIEDGLVAYLNSTDPADSISKSRWFDFDNLNFKTGSANLTDESMKQVQNIAAILKAYPKATIKIGGYTDKTGTEDANMKLSQQRAETVVGALKATGTGDTQLAGAEGYGSQFAKAAADAPDEEKKKDRRIAVNVRNK